MIKRLVLAVVVLLAVSGECFAQQGMMVEKLTFSTKGVDCYADAETNAVMAGECYALVWKRTGATFSGLPYDPPNPSNPKALGDGVWLVAYFPVAERMGEGATAFSHCPEVTIPAASFQPDDAANGTWSVYLLDTRYRDEQGMVRCGYDVSETNAPRRINAYRAVPGETTDFTLGTTMSVFADGKIVEGGNDDYSPVIADMRTQVATCQITFDAQGGACVESSRERKWGDAYGALPEVTRERCEFAGWFTDATGGEPVTAETVATADATVYAQWKCTVTFDANGGAAEEPSRIVKTNEKLGTLPTASRTGYTLSGWYTAAVDGEAVTVDTDVTAPVTYYAHWTANSYSVRFVDRDGEASIDEQTMTYDQGAALSSNRFAHVGYTFAGWTDDENEFSEVKYQNGVVVSNLTALAGGTVDLYAIWQANAYTVKFNANGGEGEMADQDFVYDQEQTLAANGFLRDGFAFDHWTNAVGQAFRDRAAVLNLTDVADEEVELFANWKVGRIWDGTVAGDWLKVTCAQDAVALGLGEEVVTDAWHYFAADSGSAASLKASGLPTGVKFDAKTGKMSGAATKRGVFYVTVAASNKSKFSQTKVMVVKVGGAEPDDRDEIGLNGAALSNLVVGTALPVGLVTIPSGASASGLPKGLTVAKKSAVDASGAVCDSLAGVPTQGGKYTVKVTAKNPNRTALLNVIVADPGSKYVTVKANDGGTATKSGVYAAGSTLKLTAKAKSKDVVFVGWTDDAGEWVRPAGADARATALSMVVGETTPACFTARFEPAAQDKAHGVAVVPVGNDWTFDGSEGPFEFLFKVESDSLPKVAVKPLPAGFAFNGAKDVVVGADGEQYYRLVVKDAMKTKPGVYGLSFNVGNASVKQTVVKDLTLVVKNKRSGLYDLEYEQPYQVSVGVGDASAYPAFAVPAGAKVAVSGLPAGLKYKDGKITGVATKAGLFTMTITTTVGKQNLVDTVFVSVSDLPAQLVGTFNGAVTDSADVTASETLVLTATAAGKLTAKVGAVSLKASGWNAFSNGCAHATLEKAPYALDLAVNTNAWDSLQVSGSFAGQASVSDVWAQRNPFGKLGKGYENPVAHELAAGLAACGKVALSAVRDETSGLWRLEEAADGRLTVQVKETGDVKISGKLGDLSASGSSVLTIAGDQVSADFVVGKGDKKVVLEILFAEGGMTGTAWTR